MKYLFESLEAELSPLEAVSNQLAFTFCAVQWKKMELNQIKELIKEKEPRIDIVFVKKTDEHIEVEFNNKELSGEFRRLF